MKVFFVLPILRRNSLAPCFYNISAAAEFIEETIAVLGSDNQEVLVERAKFIRNKVGPDEAAFVEQLNDMFAQPQ